MSRKGNRWRQKVDEWLSVAGNEIGNDSKFGGDRNVLRLDCGDSCSTTLLSLRKVIELYTRSG